MSSLFELAGVYDVLLQRLPNRCVAPLFCSIRQPRARTKAHCIAQRSTINTRSSQQYPLLHLRSTSDDSISFEKVDFEKSIGHTEPDQEVSWNRRDLLLYSVGIGASADQLEYIYERSAGFRAFPTYPTVLGLKGTSQDVTLFSDMIGSRSHTPGFPTLHPDTIVHGEQSLEILEKIPTVSGRGWRLRKRVVAIHDKPTGLIVTNEQRLISPGGKVHAITVGSAFYRGQGQGTKYSKSLIEKRIAAEIPSSSPEFTFRFTTSPIQAAIYRLSSDYNPLHIDPQVGIKGGLGGVILQGMCTYAFAARAVLQSVVPDEGQPGVSTGELKYISARFTSPVYPGQELETSIWHIGEKDGCIEIVFEQAVVGGKKSLGGGYALVRRPA